MVKVRSDFDPASLYCVHKGHVDIVDVPELGYLSIEGTGDPDGPELSSAVYLVRAVSSHVRAGTRSMPLEVVWWLEDRVRAVVRGWMATAGIQPHVWRWRAMIRQPDPVDVAVFHDAVRRAADATGPGAGRVRYLRWTEGLCAQLVHVGPYASGGPAAVRLHQAIADAGYRPRGQHHEVHLNDPSRTRPDRLRTLLRLPIEPSGAPSDVDEG